MQLEPLLMLQKWRRRGLATLLGACATAALPPVYVLPLLIPAFAGLFLLVRHAKSRLQAFSDGWWWGLGHFTAGLYWICISLWVEPEKFAWMTPFALFGVPSVVAIYTGLVTLLTWFARRLQAQRQIVVFAGLWVAVEYLRAHLFTGFPWNLIGYVWTVSDVTIQFASVVGIYGLSWLTVLVATMPALFVPKKEAENAKLPNFCAAFLLVAMALFGVWRLETHPTLYTNTRVRIVQANIPQSLKWDEKAVMQGLRKHVNLTRSPGLEGVGLVLWPETAVPYYITSKSALTEDLGHILPPNALLLTGGMRGNGYDNSQAWNSVFVINYAGEILGEYDKHHLVPFGEYVPLRGILPVEAIAGGIGDFMRGSGPRTLTIDPYPPFSPLVCYEAIFPDESTDGTHRAEWLFSLTDDAWFGRSSGPYQDLEMARMRAVEQGIPLLRAANTGLSAAYDAYGRKLASLPLEKEGILDLYLPHPHGEPSIAGRYAWSGFLFIFILSISFLCAVPKKNSASL